MKKIRVLLIDDNRQLRDRILKILKPNKDIVLLSASSESKNRYLKNQQLKPNVILIDYELQNQNSLYVVELMKEDFCEAKIIVINFPIKQSDILHYIKAGTEGFILKDASHTDFLIAVRSAAEGSTILPPFLVNSIFSQIVERAAEKSKPKLKLEVWLTNKEREVIGLLSEGLRNKEISQKINLSTLTVKSHIHNIMRKLGLHTRLEIANYSYTDNTHQTIPKKNISMVVN